jgi:hypothetical protein
LCSDKYRYESLIFWTYLLIGAFRALGCYCAFFFEDFAKRFLRFFMWVGAMVVIWAAGWDPNEN